MSDFVSPTNPENLVNFVGPVFLSAHWKTWSSCVGHTYANPRERSQLDTPSQKKTKNN